MTTETIEDIIKRIGQTMQEGNFEEAMRKVRHFALDQSIQRAQGQMEQENYQAAREAIAEAGRYAFSDEEKSRVKEAKIPIYRKSIDGALYEAVTFMASEPVTPEHVRKAVEYCQKAQEYARSIGDNIVQRIDDVIGFRYDPNQGDFPFQESPVCEPKMMYMIESVNEVLGRMGADFRIGPVYREHWTPCGDFAGSEVLPGAFGIYRRKMKDPADKKPGQSWIQAVGDIDKMVYRGDDE